MTNRTYPSALFWVDLETTGLDAQNDPILEIGVIVTDFDLVPHFGYKGIVKLSDEHKTRLRLPQNEIPLRMHAENGLIKEAKESEDTLQVIESEIIGMLKNKTTQGKGEFMVAGSGIARFDMDVLKYQMPELFSWFAYFPFDVGVLRRSSRILAGNRDVVPPIRESFQEGQKAHRAYEDVKAHLAEGQEYRKFFRWAIDKQTEE